MINLTLYKREMKGSLKLLIIFGAIITMYVSIIISMYEPQMMATLLPASFLTRNTALHLEQYCFLPPESLCSARKICIFNELLTFNDSSSFIFRFR